MITLFQLKEAYDKWDNGDEKELKKMLIPIDKALKHLKKIEVKTNPLEKWIYNVLIIYVRSNDMSFLEKEKYLLRKQLKMKILVKITMHW